MDETIYVAPDHCPWAKREAEMSSSEEALMLLREIRTQVNDMSNRLTKVETLVEVHLAKGGTVEDLKNRLDLMNTRILMFSGASGAVMWGLNKGLAALLGK